MKRSLRTPHWIVCLLLVWTASCSAPSENHNATANNNASAVAPANVNSATVTPQPATPMATAAPPAASLPPIATQPVTPPTAKPATEPATKPAAKEPATHAAGPKLVMVSQTKDLDFGEQPQDKTLVRPIRIRNGGNAVLNIESVSPS